MCVCVCVMWTVEHDLDQIDYIDSCTAEEDEDEVKPHKGLDLNLNLLPSPSEKQFMIV